MWAAEGICCTLVPCHSLQGVKVWEKEVRGSPGSRTSPLSMLMTAERQYVLHSGRCGISLAAVLASSCLSADKQAEHRT